MANDEDTAPEGMTPTGVAPLDDALGGGLSKGHTVLVAGDSGTGKTVLSFEWLFTGTAQGENGLYLAFTEQMSHTLQNMESMSFYDRSAVEDDRLTVADLRRLQQEELSPDEIIDFIEDQVTKHDAQRLVIDSVTAIAYALEDKYTIRQFIYDLGTTLASLGVTTVLTSETPDSEKVSVYGVEEFIADTILHLHREQGRTQQRRLIDIVKVRGHSYHPSRLKFSITEDGIDAIPHIDTELAYTATDEMISLGIPTLDDLLDGGVYRGSSTLVAGPTGTGKSSLGWHFLTAGLAADEPSLYVSFEESEEELFRDFSSFGQDLKAARKQKTLHVMAQAVPSYALDRHLTEIMATVRDEDIKRCVIDSLSALRIAYPEDEFLDFVQRLDRLLKDAGVTAVYTNQTTGPLIGPASTSAYEMAGKVNNIILLRFAEVQSELRPILNIVKARGTTHSARVHGYQIGKNGMTVGPALTGYAGALTGEARRVSATVEEELRDALQAEIGPMADVVLQQLAEGGLTKQAVLSQLDEWQKTGILSETEVDRLREEVLSILEE